MSATKPERRQVPADLVEAKPNMLGNWLLAAPVVVLIGWLWVDLFSLYSPLPWPWLDLLVSVGVIDQPGLNGSRFGFERALTSAKGESPAGRVDALMWAVSDHMGSLDQFDDMTVAVIAPLGS